MEMSATPTGTMLPGRIIQRLGVGAGSMTLQGSAADPPLVKADPPNTPSGPLTADPSRSETRPRRQNDIPKPT